MYILCLLFALLYFKSDWYHVQRLQLWSNRSQATALFDSIVIVGVLLLQKRLVSRPKIIALVQSKPTCSLFRFEICMSR